MLMFVGNNVYVNGRVATKNGRSDGEPVTLEYGKDLTVGRSADNDIVVTDPAVSGRHATIRAGSKGEIVIIDAGSTNGTTVQRWGGVTATGRAEVGSDGIINIGNTVILRIKDGGLIYNGSIIKRLEPGAAYKIGRDTDNDIQLPDPTVSRHHAVLFVDSRGVAYVQDIGQVLWRGSTNGT